MDNDAEVSRKLAHGMFVGPTGSGKSSLMDRLLGRPRKKSSPSTGVSEPVVVVDIDIDNPTTFHSVTVMEMDHNTWKEVDYDVSLMRQMGEGVVNSQPEDTSASLPLANIESGTESETTAAAKPKVAPTPDIVGRVMEKFGGYKNFRHFLKKSISLYLRDTGGQVEFQEMMPLLVVGPSIVFFVFRLDLDFEKKFEVKYRKSDGGSLNCYTSFITTEEAFLQCLATVYAMDMSGEASVETHKPKVFIIGTHRDKLGSDEEKIAALNKHLESLIEKSGFRDLVQYADHDKHHVMFTVSNTSENDRDFMRIQSKVNSMICDREEFTVKFPIRYLLFCLELQKLRVSALTFSECKVMAANCGIEEDQLVRLLQFLHTRVGVILHFDKDGVRDIVIKEPQVLFNYVTNLILRTFSCEALMTAQIKDFEKKGILTASVLGTALKNFVNFEFTPKQFLQLLVHLRITAPLCSSEKPSKEKQYFFPCVLNHVPESTEEPTTEILPLAVKFKCDHCPKGLFGVLVTRLMTYADSHTTTFTFKLRKKKIFKDQVSFKICSPGAHDEISLKVHPSHLEIKFFPEHYEGRQDTSIAEVCSNVREIVETSIRESLQDLHYNESRVAPKTCLRCKDCSKLHEVVPEIGNKFRCKKLSLTKSIPDEGKWWYGIGQ